MKKSILAILFGAIMVVVSACGSSTADEPEYTGPWIIGYYEDFYGIHNNCPEFNTWFNEHTSNLTSGILVKSNGEKWVITDGDIRLSDYDNYYSGQIEWIEIVDHASEAEIIKKVNSFESFSVKNEVERKYDSFKAEYKHTKK